MSDPFNDRYSSSGGMSCWGKIQAILRRTGLVLTVDEISFLCVYLWQTANPDAFYNKMNSLSDEELREWAMKAKMRKKPNLLEYERSLYA